MLWRYAATMPVLAKAGDYIHWLTLGSTAADALTLSIMYRRRCTSDTVSLLASAGSSSAGCCSVEPSTLYWCAESPVSSVRSLAARDAVSALRAGKSAHLHQQHCPNYVYKPARFLSVHVHTCRPAHATAAGCCKLWRMPHLLVVERVTEAFGSQARTAAAGHSQMGL